MKNKAKRDKAARANAQPDYSALQWKVYRKLALIALCAIAGALIAREIVRGHLGDFIVFVVNKLFGASYHDAQRFYWRYFTGKIEIYIFVVALMAFAVVARFLMSQYAKYFNEISRGLDTLVEEKGSRNAGVIKLSPEMAAMERKLNAIKLSLELRENEAKQAEQNKNDLVAYLAHDLKTPLTSVIGYLSLLGEECGAAQPDGARPETRIITSVAAQGDRPPEGLNEGLNKEYLRIALEKAYRLETLIEELFDITRYSLQSLVLSKEKINLYFMFVQMTDEFYPALSAKGMSARLDAAEDLTAYGDPDKLARVFNNILRNAVEYGPSGSAIDITAARADSAAQGASAGCAAGSGSGNSAGTGSEGGSEGGGAVTISFRNPGNIPAENLESIFDKFYRLDSARSSGSGGAGLGLAVAKDIVNAHGGTIRAFGGDGYVTFTVELPAAPDR